MFARLSSGITLCLAYFLEFFQVSGTLCALIHVQHYFLDISFFVTSKCCMHQSPAFYTLWDSFSGLRMNLYSNAKHFFIASSHAYFCFRGHKHLIDPYQNTIPRAMPLHKLKKSQLQERFMLVTHDSWSSENALHECFMAEQWC